MNRQTAIVTGASSGIGRATAVALAQQGFALGIGYRRHESGARATADLVEAAGAYAHIFALDLAKPEAAAAAVGAAIDALSGVGVFVNNAGVHRRCSLLDETVDDWNRLLAADLTGPFFCAQAAARRMVAAGTGGRIINITSIHKHEPILGSGAYCVAKAGLGLLTKVMALELAPHCITVNAIAPGETATPMNGVADDVDAASISRPGIPVGRPARAAEVTLLVAYLAGDDAVYVTVHRYSSTAAWASWPRSLTRRTPLAAPATPRHLSVPYDSTFNARNPRHGQHTVRRGRRAPGHPNRQERRPRRLHGA